MLASTETFRQGPCAVKFEGIESNTTAEIVNMGGRNSTLDLAESLMSRALNLESPDLAAYQALYTPFGAGEVDEEGDSRMPEQVIEKRWVTVVLMVTALVAMIIAGFAGAGILIGEVFEESEVGEDGDPNTDRVEVGEYIGNTSQHPSIQARGLNEIFARKMLEHKLDVLDVAWVGPV